VSVIRVSRIPHDARSALVGRSIGIGLLIVALLCAGCASDGRHGAEIRAVGDTGHAGVGIPRAEPGIAYIVGMQPICTTGHAVKIESVTAYKPTGGMYVRYWGVADVDSSSPSAGPEDFEHRSGPVSQMTGFSHANVSAGCDQDRYVERFVVSVTRRSDSTGTARGVVVHFGNDRQAIDHYLISTCAAAACANLPRT
jgi:hypothetical protein